MPAVASPAVQRDQQRVPSAKLLLGAATDAFLFRQPARTFALLSQLACGLGPAPTTWPASEHATAKEVARETVRRQTAILWLTTVVCLLVGSGSNGDGTGPSGPSQPVSSSTSITGSCLTGHSKTDDAVRSGSAEAVLLAVVDQCESLYTPLLAASPVGCRRRLSPSSSSQTTTDYVDDATSDGDQMSRRRLANSPLPVEVVQTLLLASVQLGLAPSSSTPTSVVGRAVLEPFLSAIPSSLQRRLAGLSRARESHRASVVPASSSAVTAATPIPPVQSTPTKTAALTVNHSNSWLDGILDGYEAVAHTWAIDVLCSRRQGTVVVAGEQEISRVEEAIRFVKEDRVLGQARKRDLLDAIDRSRSSPAVIVPSSTLTKSIEDPNSHTGGSFSHVSGLDSPSVSSNAGLHAPTPLLAGFSDPSIGVAGVKGIVPCDSSTKSTTATASKDRPFGRRQAEAIRRFLAPREQTTTLAAATTGTSARKAPLTSNNSSSSSISPTLSGATVTAKASTATTTPLASLFRPLDLLPSLLSRRSSPSSSPRSTANLLTSLVLRRTSLLAIVLALVSVVLRVVRRRSHLLSQLSPQRHDGSTSTVSLLAATVASVDGQVGQAVRRRLGGGGAWR